jgi:hypothetical protein
MAENNDEVGGNFWFGLLWLNLVILFLGLAVIFNWGCNQHFSRYITIIIIFIVLMQYFIKVKMMAENEIKNGGAGYC